MGHIPADEEIQDSEILSFYDAKQQRKESETYDRTKWLYVPDFYSEYRYILGTKGSTPLITIGINPSTASPDHLDNTLKSVERIAMYNGYDSFIMFNVYAQRATDPNHMNQTLNRKLHEENMLAFEWVLKNTHTPPSIWAAWGSIIEKRDYLKTCVMDMLRIGEHYGAKWYHAGPLSVKGGHPHHPLYLKRTSEMQPFDIQEYLLPENKST